MAAYRQADYRVEVIALAVPEAVSQLGVLDRYLRLADEGRVRYVSWENHDRCAAGLLTSLEAVEAEHLADRVVVLRRAAAAAGPALYDNTLDPAGQWRRPTGAARAVRAERARPWTAQETGLFRRQLADADRRAHRTAPDGHLPEGWGLAVQRDAERAAALAEPVRRLAQARPEPPGVDYHRLCAEEHRFIFDELVAPSLLDGVTPQERPVVVYVLGQPGAGKTRTALMVRRALRGRPVRITAERFMVAHPDFRQLLRDEPQTAELRIRADYRSWQAQAEALVRARRGDVVIEITPDSIGEFTSSAALYRQAGYRVELAVLAVRAADSRQGSAARYAGVSRYGSRPARLTPVSEHDARFGVLAPAVAAAEQDGLADCVTVMGRDGQAVYRNDRTDGRWQRPPAAAQALAAEQARPYTPEKAAQFLAAQRRLRAVLPQHRDELVAISRLARPLMPLRLQSPPLPRPVSPAALPLPAPLVPAPRDHCSSDSSSVSRAS
ncbi:zeta toxin family protein [Streptomyces halobius]|uniref:UDP-N-acetylglucosamine kinase n=1 Tax=Streptomyces halobius TaxID=2879846 RepID=A0ABY4M512_9ACTN|nr:zeta toxin family protein [Streptomyces halobius]UQA91471.1 zeta toxin family protein [Streptomyces halobius]